VSGPHCSGGTEPRHSHGDGNRHADGRHDHAHRANRQAVGRAALLTGGFMVVEVIGGIVAGALALLADAGHMLSDFAALAMAWLAFRVAMRPADATRTFGFDRLSILAAFVNGLALFAVAIWIVIEAAQRIGEPRPVAGGLMLAVAAIGLGVNVLAFLILSRGDRDNLNLRAALLHVVGDLLGSLAAIAAALVILATGWTPIDPILSVLVAVLILRSAWIVVRDSAHILLEGTPPGFDAAAIAADLLAEVPVVTEVRHLHAWSITEARPMVTLEAIVAPGGDIEAARRAIKARLAVRFGFDHATVEMLAGPGPDGARLPAGDHRHI
jgi:cobalt-zinc-cadmium efflux system protein